MIWALGQDIVDGTQPLLEAVGRSMQPLLAVKKKDREHPRRFRLANNYPNPFNADTNIPFYLPARTNIRIDIFDISGQLLNTLLNARLDAGWHKVRFNAMGYSTGIYCARIRAGDEVRLLKLTYVK